MSMSTGCNPRRSRYLEALKRKRRETIFNVQDSSAIRIKSESEEEEDKIFDDIKSLYFIQKRTKSMIANQYKKLESIRKKRELRAAVLKERMKQEEKRRKELQEERLDLLPDLKDVATQTEYIVDHSINRELDLPFTDFSSATILNFKSKDGHSMGHLDTNLGDALETITTLVDSNDTLDFTLRKVPSNKVPVTSKYFKE